MMQLQPMIGDLAKVGVGATLLAFDEAVSQANSVSDGIVEGTERTGRLVRGLADGIVDTVQRAWSSPVGFLLGRDPRQDLVKLDRACTRLDQSLSTSPRLPLIPPPVYQPGTG